MWHLIMLSTVCKHFSNNSLGISNSCSLTYLKLKFDSSEGSLFSLKWVNNLPWFTLISDMFDFNVKSCKASFIELIEEK